MAHVAHAEDHIRYPRNVSSHRPLCHVLVVPGNPGLVSFYQEFISELYALMEDVPNGDCVVEGYSLGGFQITSPSPQPLGLQQQVNYVEAFIERAVRQDSEVPSKKVILIGHSVGAYLLLEILRRHQERRKEREPPYNIIGGICLFPTVVDIAQSKSGRRVRHILNLPAFALIASFVITSLLRIIPHFFLVQLVRVATQFPDDAVQTVAAYLQSKTGLQETFHMARDEMNEITTDRWNEEVWGSAAGASEQRTKLYFYFGEEDHWVAKKTRDDLMATRALRPDAKEDWRPKMEIDQSGVPHGFCIRG